jgi:hypothetical protein
MNTLKHLFNKTTFIFNFHSYCHNMEINVRELVLQPATEKSLISRV